MLIISKQRRQTGIVRNDRVVLSEKLWFSNNDGIGINHVTATDNHDLIKKSQSCLLCWLLAYAWYTKNELTIRCLFKKMYSSCTAAYRIEMN